MEEKGAVQCSASEAGERVRKQCDSGQDSKYGCWGVKLNWMELSYDFDALILIKQMQREQCNSNGSFRLFTPISSSAGLSGSLKCICLVLRSCRFDWLCLVIYC